MSSFMQLILAMAIIIVAAKISGYISYRLGQPSVLGEILVGIIIGPSVLNLFQYSYFSDKHLLATISEFAELGVLVLMFMAGLDLHINDLLHSSKTAVLAGVFGMLLPLLMGMGTGLLYDMSLSSALFLGLILSATSVSISAQTLLELKAIRSRVGISMLGAAVVDDVLVVLGLSAFIALLASEGGGGLSQILLILLAMVIFIMITSVIGYWFLPKLARIIDKMPISQGLIAFAFVTILLYSWMAEQIGSMAAITGAFLAGLWLSRSQYRERIATSISVMAYAVFVPIFFINIGLSADLQNVTGGFIWMLLVMTIIAIIGKILGSGLGAKLSGFTNRESLQLGVGMMSRGEVGLIVASVGTQNGYIGQNFFSAAVGVVIITTLLTPPALRYLFSKPAQDVKEKTQTEDKKPSATKSVKGEAE
ncbi:MAG: cation:proton antiporter [Anaerolineales bacterium]|nr:cation:proton antiporter [Anaerolineales bacterium]